MTIRVSGILCFLLVFSMIQPGFGQKRERGYFAWALKGEFRPFIEANYGIGTPKHLDFSETFAKYGLIEARVGYSEIIKYRHSIYEMDERFAFGNYLSSDADFLDDKSGNIKSEVTRFGVGNRLGYGYRIGAINLLPYNQNQFIWSRIQTERPEDIIPEDESILNRYEGSYRFGVSGEAGAKLELFESLAVQGGFEFAVVYPRHIFWPWLGSYIIVQTGLGMVSAFSEDIVKSSPIFGPIAYFLLKNGIAYAFYTGLQKRMNWPFDSETPVTFETYKIGASIKF